MKVIDLHCDALMKMFQDRTISFSNSEKLAVNYKQLKQANSKLQYFAVFVPEQVHPQLRFEAALQMIQIFSRKVLSLPNMKLVRNSSDYYALQEGEIGAVLALEGCDAIQEDLVKLATLKQLGVSSVGLTWNYGNVYADGAMERRNAGLSMKGVELVQWLKAESILLDVSHLSEASFWDSLAIGGKVFASHSNCKAICEHPRNLSNEQILELINNKSLIGLTFVPEFVSSKPNVSIQQLLNHIEHICSLGGVTNIAFGSDFDGIKRHVKGLTSYSSFETLQEELLKYYSHTQVEGFLQKNYERFVLD